MDASEQGCVMHSEDEYCEITTWQGSVECPKCGAKVPSYHWHSPRKCIRAQLRREARGKGQVLPIYLVVQGISRYYGGPEEGGWYWDRSVIMEVRKVWTFRAARQAIRELRDDYPPPSYPRGSVLGGQDIYIRVCVNEGEFPREILTPPRYE